MSASARKSSDRNPQPGERPEPARHQHDASCHHLDSRSPAVGLARSAESGTADLSGGRAVDTDVRGALSRRAGRGTSLSPGIATDLGDKLSADFSRVRIHADPEADTIARSVQATAFTLGSDIYFSKGTYSPGTSAGRSLLAHELTHVRQHQEGRGSTGGGLTVGRTDDPAEREADHVARTVGAGGRMPRTTSVVAGGQQSEGSAVRRTTSVAPTPAGDLGTIRRLFGFGGTKKEKTEQVKSALTESLQDHNSTLGEFEELTSQIAGMSDAADTVTGGLGYASGVGGVLGGARDAVGGAWDIAAGGVNVHQGYQKHDFGAEGGGRGGQGDSITKNLGAQQIEGGLQRVMTGGAGMGAGVGNIVTAAAEEIPFLDTATNLTAAAVKTKQGIEDAATSGRLGNQKVRIKREGDQFLPEPVRAQRFGEFVTSLKTGKGFKKSDVKRWDEFYAKWLAHTAAMPQFSKRAEQGRAQLMVGQAQGATPSALGTVTTGWHPLEADWSAVGPEHKVFLAFLQTVGKDFGFGTEHRKAHEAGLTSGGQRASEEETSAGRSRIERTKAPVREGADHYEQMRDLGKVASFGQRRKGETATVNLVEAAGHTLDGVGSITAGADYGATKATGKIIKSLSAAYKGIKGLVKRARRVDKLIDAKNATEYGGKSDRGVLWGAQQFFFGNVTGQMDRSKQALENSVENTDFQEEQRAWTEHRDLYQQQQALIQQLAQERIEADNEPDDTVRTTKLAAIDAATVAPGDVIPDAGPPPRPPRPGAQKPTHQNKQAKAMTSAQAAPHLKKLTLQLDRKIDDLVDCLLSDNATVRKRAHKILHIIAETNLAGAIQRIDEQELEQLFVIHTSLQKDPAYRAQHKPAFDQRITSVRAIVSKQLAGIGG